MLVTQNLRWHRKVDVVVIGFGLAGAASAVTAHDQGAEVVILEKQNADGHVSNSMMSAGVFISPTDVKDAVSYMEGLNRVTEGVYWTDKDIIRVWAEYCAQNKSWIEGFGGSVTPLGWLGEHTDLPGYRSIQTYVFKGMGWGLMGLMEKQLRSRSIDILYGVRVTNLLIDLQGRVIGVRAERGGAEYNVKASRGVVLAPGGFEYDEEMKLNYLKTYPTYFTGPPTNTGDGIRMAQEVGASLWHMNCVSGGIVAKVPDMPSFRIDLAARLKLPVIKAPDGIPLHERLAGEQDVCGYVIVDKHGRRFFNESLMFLKMHAFYYEFTAYDVGRREFPRIPSYGIIDRKRIEAGPLPGAYATFISKFWGYSWSRHSRSEIESGWVVQADTVKELADRIGLDGESLSQTVTQYNEYCQQRQDPEFHRPPQHLTPLDEPPFFAIELWPGGPNTQGGPRRNHKAQILNFKGEPVPRLYGAGECGSIYGMFYPTGGGNLAECIAFGRIAGEQVAKEKPLP